MGATTFNGRSFTQLTRLNVVDEFRVNGIVFNPTATADILITAVEDFPNQDATTITWQDGDQYRISGAVDLGNKVIQIDQGATVAVYGGSPFNDSLTTGSTGALISGTDIGLFCYNLGLKAQNGTYFSFNKSASSPTAFSFIFFSAMIYSDCVNFADLDSLNFFSSNGALVTNISGRGVVAQSTVDNFDNLVFNNLSVEAYQNTLLDLGTATFQVVDITGNTFKNQAGNVLLSGASGSANILSGGQGTVANNISSGLAAVINGVQVSDVRWEFLVNNRLSDSERIGGLFMENNATDTVIDTQNVAVKVAGATTVNAAAQRFDMPSNNTVRYIGDKNIDADAAYSITALRSSGSGTRLFRFTVYKNGSPLTGASQVMDTDNRERNLTVTVNTSMSQNDTLELFVTNTEGNQNIRVTQLQCNVRG